MLLRLFLLLLFAQSNASFTEAQPTTQASLGRSALVLTTNDSIQAPKRAYGDRALGKSVFRRNIAKDVKFVGKAGVSDAVWVYSSPTRFSTRSALVIAGVAAIGAAVYFLDDEIASGVRRNGEKWPLQPLHELGELLEPVGRQATMNKYFLGTAALSYIIGFEWLARMSSEILESYLIAGPPKVATNKMTGRPRPLNGYESDYWNFFTPGQSFFSGHTSHAFQIARVMDEHIHFVPVDILLYISAASVGIERIDSRWHWPSDVWVGGVYGYVVADALAGKHRMQWLTVRPYSSVFGQAPGISVTAKF